MSVKHLITALTDRAIGNTETGHKLVAYDRRVEAGKVAGAALVIGLFAVASVEAFAAYRGVPPRRKTAIAAAVVAPVVAARFFPRFMRQFDLPLF